MYLKDRKYDRYFKDKSREMLLPMERYDRFMLEREYNKKLLRKQAYEDEKRRRLEAGKSLEGLKVFDEEIIPPPADPREGVPYDADNVKYNGGAQSFPEIFGLSYNSTMVETIGDFRFELNLRRSFKEVEVVKKPAFESAVVKRDTMHERTSEKERKEINLANKYPACKRYADKVKLTAKLKSYSVDQWITLCALLFRSIPSSVTAIDLDIKKIAFNSGRYVARGATTIMQLEAIIDLREQKEMLLNIYVLNKFFAALIRNSEEREVFLCVILKEKGTNTLEGPRLRAMYRMRRDLTRRFREFCVRRGYNAEWFFDHFAFLPSVRYAAENSSIDKKFSELNMEKYEKKYENKDVLGFLDEFSNIEGK